MVQSIAANFSEFFSVYELLSAVLAAALALLGYVCYEEVQLCHVDTCAAVLPMVAEQSWCWSRRTNHLLSPPYPTRPSN